MKFFISILLITPAFVGAQYESSGYQSPGMNLISESSRIEYTKANEGNPNRGYANSLKSSYESKLLNEANRRLKSAISNQKIIDRHRQRHFSRETVLASAWAHSGTGLSSGIVWWDLSDNEKEIYRSRFKTYWSQPLQSKPTFSQRSITKENSLEKEMALAWAQSKTGQKDGRTWANIPAKEKTYYSNNYLARKNNNLLPNKPTSIPQSQYKESWLALQSCGAVEKSWNELSSLERSTFRKEFSESSEDLKRGLLALK